MISTILLTLIALLIVVWITSIPFVGRRTNIPGRHTDWIWPLSLVPRSWTSFHARRPPVKAFGNTPDSPFRKLNGDILLYPKPIPERGRWHFAFPFYVALQTKSGWHARLGIRFDDVDNEYEIPSAKIGRYQN